MKVTVDASVCIGAGMCALTAPAVFDQDEDDGTVVLLDGTPPPGLHAAVRQAGRLCPSGAITVLDTGDPGDR
ncbi:ferredoxin [Streptosporangium becharense]|uniref:Ferredoxin n=1 Tax=Streptosporangium becharense TaxID=1816182 RepID=A0A7W9IH33_9ACTN|nr:ferredoxin [Streptosporangium becharense]MBB2912503.1 ferredoxin [Streptosporangium becharense]MBB5820667.1 ferredoxin [Streptosporangium becharense]